MPTYEYVCRNCGHGFEAVQAFEEPPRTDCPECGGPLKKVYGTLGILFKGSGFYKTDNRPTSGESKTPAVSTNADGASSSHSEHATTSARSKGESAKTGESSSSAPSSPST